ncbi:MAG: glycosyltransferase family 2 protein [Chlamydiales bacterium]
MISVCILTKNGQATIRATLDSVRLFPEVLILDTESTDDTISIAKKYPNVKVHETTFCGFGPLRNIIAERASHDWILAIDSDEILSEGLIQEILSLSLDSSFAYTIPRHNFYRGKRILGCGWSPDAVARLYHRKTTRFSAAKVHESLETKNLIPLQYPLLHTPYRSTSDFLAKMQHYSTLFAEQYKGKRKSSFTKALVHGFFAFFRSYLLKRGMIDGTEGFIISLYNANTAFYKYLKLNELNEALSDSSVPHESLDRPTPHQERV